MATKTTYPSLHFDLFKFFFLKLCTIIIKPPFGEYVFFFFRATFKEQIYISLGDGF